MAEKHLLDGKDSCRREAVAVNNEVNSHTSKRCASSSPPTAPPNKSPRTSLVSPTTHAGKEASETHRQEMQTENSEEQSCPSGSLTDHRKSWRRATITRRSLPFLPNPYQVLCRSISTTLKQHERLEKLMEASMMLAIERTQNSLQSLPNTSLESFQKQVNRMQKEWSCLAKSIQNEKGHRVTANAASNPALQKAMENVQKTINRLQAENESWETLLGKHRRKAEELERKVEQGQDKGVSLDSSSLAQSSQYFIIQSKPDYYKILCRQRPMLQTVEMIIDTQCKMVRGLLSIKEQSQLVVKETSGRLVAESGFQNLSSDLIRNLLAAPGYSAAM